MKVFVDFEDLDTKDITDNALIKISRKAKPELCECVKLSSLVDHDKQVRKQVCDEIINRSAKSYSGYAFNLGKDVYSYTVCDFVLDQIEKGESYENNKETNA